jgi:hypothetical protein
MTPTLQPHNPESWYKWFLLAMLIIMGLILASCDCNYHLKQIKKKCGSHAQLDTIHVRDTIFVKESKIDTVFKWTKTSDTVRLNNDRLHIKYFYNTHDSTVYIQGKCDSLTIYRDKVVYVDKNVFEFDYIAKYKWYILIPLLIVLVVFIIKKLLT